MTSVAALRRLLRDATGPWRFYVGYGIGRGSALIALPAVAHIIGPSGLGRLEVATAILSAAAIVLDAGMATAVVRYLRDPRWDESTVIASAFRLQALVGMLTMVLCVPIMLAIGPDESSRAGLAAIVVVYAFCEGFAVFGGGLLRAREADSAYLLLSIARMVLTVSVAVVGAHFAGWAGALVGMAVGGAGFAAYALRARLRVGRGRYRRDVSVLMARYGFPLIATTACSWTLALSDRLFLQASVTPAELGRYSANYRMGSLILTFLAAPLVLAWLPQALRLDAEGRAAAQRRLTAAFTCASVAIGGCLCLLSPFAIPLLFGEGFDGSPVVVGFISLAGWLGGLYYLILTPLFLSDSTRRLSEIAVAATAINIAANALLIPPLGTTGALIATVSSYLVLVALASLAVRRSATVAVGPVLPDPLPGEAVLPERAMTHCLLFVVQIYPDGGGISSILENYVAELSDDHRVHVAIVEERPGARDRLALPPEHVHVLGYTNAINPMLMPTSVAYAAWVGLKLRQLVRRLQPSAVITQDALNLPVPALIAVAGSRARVVVMDHGTLTNVHDDAWLPMLVRRLGTAKGHAFRLGFVADAPWRRARWLLARSRADELWYTGEELASWFDGANGRSKRYAQTVPRDFVPPTGAGRAAAREQLGVDPDITLVNYVGRLDGEKGLDTIVDAVANVQPTRGWQLLVAGDGSLEPWLQAAIAERGIENRVRLLGRLDREHVRVLQFASDFHLYAGTISCGVSICLLEAMAAGVIPIVSDVPRLQRELVDGAGWVFPAGDAAALERALGEALASGSQERMRRRERVLEQIGRQASPTVPQLVRSMLGQPARVPRRHGR